MTAAHYLATGIISVDGWLSSLDAHLIDEILAAQEEAGVTGDLLEIGAYLGKSAILIGYHRRETEDFVICDAFDAEEASGDNLAENNRFYENLTLATFEANYRRFHERPPTVLPVLSSKLLPLVAGRVFRFIHLDASHVYEQVVEDIETIRQLVAPGAIVVFDDIRREHTPGVPAAVWQAVKDNELIPLIYGSDKLYATWGRAEEVVWARVAARRICSSIEEVVAGHTVEILIPSQAKVPDWPRPAAAPPTWREQWLPPALLQLLRRCWRALQR